MHPDGLDILQKYSSGIADANVSSLAPDLVEMDIPFRSLYSEDTGSIEAFQTVLGWLGNCMSWHSACGSGSENSLPSRVLNLGLVDSGTTMDARMDVNSLKQMVAWVGTHA